jgi:hypothetical protein
MSTPPVPPSVPGANLDALERLGKIVNTVGVPLLLVFFLAINIGWIDSPLSKNIEENTRLNHEILTRLAEHHREMEAREENRSREVKEAFETIKRLTELIKMIDCSAIPDPQLRQRCLGR